MYSRTAATRTWCTTTTTPSTVVTLGAGAADRLDAGRLAGDRAGARPRARQPRRRRWLTVTTPARTGPGGPAGWRRPPRPPGPRPPPARAASRGPGAPAGWRRPPRPALDRRLLAGPVRAVEHPAELLMQRVADLLQHVHPVHGRPVRRRQPGRLGVVDPAPDVPDGYHLDLIRADEPQTPVGSDHNAVEQAEFRHLKDVLQSADLRAGAAEHRRAGHGALIRDSRVVVTLDGASAVRVAPAGVLHADTCPFPLVTPGSHRPSELSPGGRDPRMSDTPGILVTCCMRLVNDWWAGTANSAACSACSTMPRPAGLRTLWSAEMPGWERPGWSLNWPRGPRTAVSWCSPAAAPSSATAFPTCRSPMP